METGHVEFDDVSVITVKNAKNRFAFCRVELDHESETFNRMLIKMTKDDEQFIEIDCSTEAASILVLIFSFYSHPHVHYWANGVAQVCRNKKPFYFVDKREVL